MACVGGEIGVERALADNVWKTAFNVASQHHRMHRNLGVSIWQIHLPRLTSLDHLVLHAMTFIERAQGPAVVKMAPPAPLTEGDLNTTILRRSW